MGCLKSFQDVLGKKGNEETTSGKIIRIFFYQKDNLFPRNLQQDPLNGPLHLSKSNSSSNLLRGPLVRSHAIFDGLLFFLPTFDVLVGWNQDLDIVDLAGTLDWTPPVNVSGELLTYRGRKTYKYWDLSMYLIYIIEFQSFSQY